MATGRRWLVESPKKPKKAPRKSRKSHGFWQAGLEEFAKKAPVIFCAGCEGVKVVP